MDWQPIETVPDTDEQVLFWTRGGAFYAGPARRLKIARADLVKIHSAIHRETGEWPSAAHEPTHWCRVTAPEDSHG